MVSSFSLAGQDSSPVFVSHDLDPSEKYNNIIITMETPKGAPLKNTSAVSSQDIWEEPEPGFLAGKICSHQLSRWGRVGTWLVGAGLPLPRPGLQINGIFNFLNLLSPSTAPSF